MSIPSITAKSRTPNNVGIELTPIPVRQEAIPFRAGSNLNTSTIANMANHQLQQIENRNGGTPFRVGPDGMVIVSKTTIDPLVQQAKSLLAHNHLPVDIIATIDPRRPYTNKRQYILAPPNVKIDGNYLNRVVFVEEAAFHTKSRIRVSHSSLGSQTTHTTSDFHDAFKSVAERVRDWRGNRAEIHRIYVDAPPNRNSQKPSLRSAL